MKKITKLLMIFALTGLGFACDSDDAFRDYGSDIRNATVEEEEPPTPPGINSNSILLSPSKRVFLFEEGVEAAYELNARVFIPDAEFELELVNPPQGMTLELKNVIGTETQTTEVDSDSEADDSNDQAQEDGDSSAEDGEEEQSSVNQKIYSVKWKPGYETIPDDTVSSIQRYISVRFKVDEDIATLWEIPYEVFQSERSLKIVSADVPQTFMEGESTNFKVYVEYPGANNFGKYPDMAIYSTDASSYNGCSNLQNWISLEDTKLVQDPNNPAKELLEYKFEANFSNLEITNNMTTCSVNAALISKRIQSKPYQIDLSVENLMSAPQTTWNDDLVLEFEQGKPSAFFFTVFGKKGEGSIELDFVSPCKAVLNGQGDCTCQQGTSYKDKHIMNCVVSAEHKIFDSPVEYTLEMRTKMVQGNKESQLVKLKRKIKFYPPEEKTNASGVNVNLSEKAKKELEEQSKPSTGLRGREQ